MRRKSDGAPYLWDLRGTTVTDITDYSLVGWEEAMYKHEVRKFYRSQLSLAQTVVLGIDLLSLAKSTSNYVGGDTQVIVALKSGIWMDLPEDVKKLEERIARFNEELGRIALVCLDVSIPDREFAVLFNRFEKQINLLRRTYAEAAVIGHTTRQVRTRSQEEKEAWQGFPYPKYSFDALVDLLYARERIKRAISEANEAEATSPKRRNQKK